MDADSEFLGWIPDKPNCKACEQVLLELENIDDECDLFGIQMVKIQDPQMAKRYGIKPFPAIVYFRNGNPLLYEGKMNEPDPNNPLPTPAAFSPSH